jgi:hypothetical protein
MKFNSRARARVSGPSGACAGLVGVAIPLSGLMSSSVAMQEELNNFKRNKMWSLVERPKQNIVGTKWVFHNKQDEHGVVTRNKA